MPLFILLRLLLLVNKSDGGNFLYIPRAFENNLWLLKDLARGFTH